MITFEKAKQIADLKLKEIEISWGVNLNIAEELTIHDDNCWAFYFGSGEIDQPLSIKIETYDIFIIDKQGRYFDASNSDSIEYYLIDFNKFYKKYLGNKEKIEKKLVFFNDEPFIEKKHIFQYVYSFFWHLLKRIHIYFRKRKRKKLCGEL
jgi:hypothetical protein